MKKQLDIVKGAVSKKDMVPVLTAFHIYNGRLQGMNGFLAIDTACNDFKGMNITIPAERFIKAVGSCQNEPTLTLTKSSLLVKGKGLKVTIPLMAHDVFPKQEVEGQSNPIKGLIEVLKTLVDFVAQDATRPWACGILLKDNYAYATNNVSIVRVPFKHSYDRLLLPLYAINELLRINQDPMKIHLTDSWITFSMKDCWLKARQLEGQWPDVSAMFEDKATGKVPENLANNIETLSQFVNKGGFPVIKFEEDKILLEGGGAEVECKNLPAGLYRAEPLIKCLRVATHIDFNKYPEPVPFKGKGGLQGVIVGLHS